MASTLLLLKGISILPLGLRLQRYGRSSSALGLLTSVVGRAFLCTATDPTPKNVSNAAVTDDDLTKATPPFYSRTDHPDYRRWKLIEDEILKDIDSITLLTKDILHSNRYMDGERLTTEDEKAVVEKLLAYHPHSEDKIGCGLHFIMVDRHPQFRNSRCLFVVRTDGGWIDFSYQKCLRAYVRAKYPSYAEKFIREHFKRTST
ncbi:DCL protein (DUF3223) [Tasmannia lanceolata]|uniref:DCL protein (DUF3223) n=1 Tax=Tasmannia lanceolata TaxID=3420 RepID=UPI0040627D0D